MNLESSILQNIRLASAPAILFRNQSGAYTTKEGMFIRYGLGQPGGSDLIGIVPVKITSKMVGQTFGRFIAIEVKTPRGHTDPKRLLEQQNFLIQIQRQGGLAGFAASPAEAQEIIRGR